MAQTTGGISLKDCKVEVSTNGSTWTDISGFATSVEVGGGTRPTAEAYTFDGDTAIITAGKREPIEVTVKAVYTEGTSEPFETVRAAYEAGSDFYVRWSPKGGQAGEFVFSSGKGIVKSLTYPQGEAGSGDPVLVEFTLVTPSITKSAAA